MEVMIFSSLRGLFGRVWIEQGTALKGHRVLTTKCLHAEEFDLWFGRTGRALIFYGACLLHGPN